MVLGFDLGKDFPVLVTDHLKEEDFGRGSRLTDGLWLPLFHVLEVEDVVAELALGDPCRITGEMLVDQPHIAVVRVAGAVAAMSEVEQFTVTDKWSLSLCFTGNTAKRM